MHYTIAKISWLVKYINTLVSTLPPSPPRYWNHGVREEKSTRSLILKDLHLKSLRTNDLRCQRALNMGLGSFEGRLGRRARLCRPNQRAIVALGGLEPGHPAGLA